RRQGPPGPSAGGVCHAVPHARDQREGNDDPRQQRPAAVPGRSPQTNQRTPLSWRQRNLGGRVSPTPAPISCAGVFVALIDLPLITVGAENSSYTDQVVPRQGLSAKCL